MSAYDPKPRRVGAAQGMRGGVVAPAVGQCQLAKSGSNLVLSPFNGNLLAGRRIPDAGISLAATGLSNSTLYYIYAVIGTNSVQKLEASTTAYASTTLHGLKYKSGDPSRLLVGMAYLSGSAFVDSVAQRFTRTWFNNVGVRTFKNFTANRTTTSTSFTELNTEIRNELLLWSGETVHVTASGLCSNGATGQNIFTSLAVDSTTVPVASGGGLTPYLGGAIAPTAVAHVASGLSEGYHYVTMIGKVDSDTGTWYGDSDGRRCAVACSVA